MSYPKVKLDAVVDRLFQISADSRSTEKETKRPYPSKEYEIATLNMRIQALEFENQKLFQFKLVVIKAVASRCIDSQRSSFCKCHKRYGPIRMC
ncbi:unnamed protein product [Caenorhabditis nigoni]